MQMTIENANDTLRGFTDVLSLEFNWSLTECRYDFKLVLTNDSSQKRTLLCNGVSGVKLSRFGGGMSQFMLLKLIDVRAHQWDRVSYKLRELEHEAIFLRCQSFVMAES